MSDLISAAKNGYHDNLENLLSTGISTESRDKDDATALYWGACRGHLKICETLLKLGCMVDAKVKWGSSALHAASDRGHLECVKLLTSWGADINLRNSRGDTPLHLAAYRGFADIVDALISSSANPFVQNQACKTPLQEALCQQHSLAAQKLHQYMSTFSGSNSLPGTSSDVNNIKFYHTTSPPSWPQDGRKGFLNVCDNVSLGTSNGVNNPVTSKPVGALQQSKQPMKRTEPKENSCNGQGSVNSTNQSYSGHETIDLVTWENGQERVSAMNRTNVRESIDLLKIQRKRSEVSRSLIGDSNLKMPLHDYLSIGSDVNVQPKVNPSKDGLQRGQSNQDGREVLESFAESLQMEVVKQSELCLKQDLQIKDLEKRLQQLEMLNRELATQDVRSRAELEQTQEMLARERRKNFEVVKQQKLLTRSMSSSVSDPRKASSMTLGSKVTHEHLLDFVKSQDCSSVFNSSSVLDNLRTNLNRVWLQPCNVTRLDSVREWVAGEDYDVVGDGPLNHLDDGVRSGSCSLVFQIKRRGTMYILKMMINLINLDFTKHDQGCSLDGYLIQNFGPEYHVPLLLAKHRNIVNVIHYYQGSTDRFRKYQNLLVPSNLDVPIEMASRTSFLVLQSYPQTLLSFMVNQRTICPTPCYGLPNSFLLLLLYQLLAVIDYLQSNHIVHRDIKGDNVFLDRCLRPVLADFGFARSLHTPEGRQQIFADKSQSCAGNSFAWAPELTRLHHYGPESLPRQTFLQEIYAKSDVFAVSRMFYSLLRPLGDRDYFPQSSVNKPHYEDCSIPDLPSSFSPGLREVLRQLVLDNPEQRPTARRAMLRVGVLLFPPCSGEVTVFEDVSPYLQAQGLKLLALNKSLLDPEMVMNVEESISMVMPEVEASFLANVTTKEFWEEYTDLKEKSLIAKS